MKINVTNRERLGLLWFFNQNWAGTVQHIELLMRCYEELRMTGCDDFIATVEGRTVIRIDDSSIDKWLDDSTADECEISPDCADFLIKGYPAQTAALKYGPAKARFLRKLKTAMADAGSPAETG